ncbi:MAG: alpha/beta hydrolase [Actinobacteria bacterium]|nr:alpha/beta hydrolase [Actinomycetota bacterium]
MPLDPEIQTFLDNLALLDPPKVSTTPVDEVRHHYVIMGMLTPVSDDVVVEELEVAGGDGPIAARLFRADDGVLPGLVYFHGGGHVIGSPETHAGVCGILARAAGCAVVAVDYRRAPEHPFPADVHDAEAAVADVAARASALGIDATRLAVGGDSAGGNLAAVAALRARDTGGPALAATLLVYPWVDIGCDRPSMSENAEGKLMEREALEHWRDLYTAGDAALTHHPEASVLYADDLSGLPPTVVVTAEGDPLRDQDLAFVERLEAAGVDLTHLHSDDLIHAFCQLAGVSERARAATEEAGVALRKLLYA